MTTNPDKVLARLERSLKADTLSYSICKAKGDEQGAACFAKMIEKIKAEIAALKAENNG